MPKTVGAMGCRQCILCVRIPPTEEKSFYDKDFTSLFVSRHRMRGFCYAHGRPNEICHQTDKSVR